MHRASGCTTCPRYTTHLWHHCRHRLRVEELTLTHPNPNPNANQASTSCRRACPSTTAPCASSCDAAPVDKPTLTLTPASRAPQPSASAASAVWSRSEPQPQPAPPQPPRAGPHARGRPPGSIPAAERLVWRLTAPQPPHRLQQAHCPPRSLQQLIGSNSTPTRWDTAGQERFRSLIPSYIRDSQARPHTHTHTQHSAQHRATILTVRVHSTARRHDTDPNPNPHPLRWR